MTPAKGKLRNTYISVAEHEYLKPEKVNPCRLQCRRLGLGFKSGKRFVRFDGVRIALTVITVRGTLL